MAKVGNLNDRFHYSFDHDFFYRIYRAYGKPKILDRDLSSFRLHETSKTTSGSEKFARENREVGLIHARQESFARRLELYALFARYRFKKWQ